MQQPPLPYNIADLTLDEVISHLILGDVLIVSGGREFPVALNNGHVLLGKAPDLSVLGGRIVAVVTRPDEFSTEHFAYLKRLGKPMPGVPSVFYLENVGQ